MAVAQPAKGGWPDPTECLSDAGGGPLPMTQSWQGDEHAFKPRIEAGAKPAPAAEEGHPATLFLPFPAALSGWTSIASAVKVSSTVMGGATKCCPSVSPSLSLVHSLCLLGRCRGWRT